MRITRQEFIAVRGISESSFYRRDFKDPKAPQPNRDGLYDLADTIAYNQGEPATSEQIAETARAISKWREEREQEHKSRRESIKELKQVKRKSA